MPYKDITPPAGDKITRGQTLSVPDHPVIPFILGDGTGPDIWAASVRVFDAAVEKAYGGQKKIAWFEVFAGQAAMDKFDTWLPDDTVGAFREVLVGIKGPLTTPVGGGIRSLNVALRQLLDLYVCLRPVRYFPGVPSPVKRPELVDMVIFRENSEDIYAGIEWQAETPEAQHIISFLQDAMGVKKIRFPQTSGIGVKPVSREGSERLIRAALDFAISHKRKSLTLVHKGNIMKFTEGAFRDWGYELVKKEFAGRAVGWDDCGGKASEGQILVWDNIADITLQQVLTRPDEFDILATLNLNGDYLSDALALFQERCNAFLVVLGREALLQCGDVVGDVLGEASSQPAVDEVLDQALRQRRAGKEAHSFRASGLGQLFRLHDVADVADLER